MIQTIKLPYQTSSEAIEYISDLQRQYSIVFRSAFNKCYKFDEVVLKELRESVRGLNNVSDIDSWWLMCAVGDAYGFYKSSKERGNKKVIFGGRNNFIKRMQNKISSDEFKKLRVRRILSVGEQYHKGNRKFEFNVIEDNKIIFKPKRGVKFELILPKLRKKYKNLLYRVQNLMEEKKIPVTISLDQKYIYISFEEKIELQKKSEGNYIGIDLNPNYISLVLFDKNQEIKNQWTWRLTKLTSKSSEYSDNKLKFETLEISKKISQICKFWKVDFVFIEDLKIKTDNKNKGKWFNRLCNNTWKRNIFVNNLKKRMDILGIKVFEVNPMYSSFIGNLTNLYPDPISAAIEIARRGYGCIIKKTKEFYPKLQASLVTSQWKDLLLGNEFASWKELFGFIKNSGMRYRVSWSDDWVFREYKIDKTMCDVCYKQLY